MYALVTFMIKILKKGNENENFWVIWHGNLFVLIKKKAV